MIPTLRMAVPTRGPQNGGGNVGTPNQTSWATHKNRPAPSIVATTDTSKGALRSRKRHFCRTLLHPDTAPPLKTNRNIITISSTPYSDFKEHSEYYTPNGITCQIRANENPAPVQVRCRDSHTKD